jgi:hypothetical protein
MSRAIHGLDAGFDENAAYRMEPDVPLSNVDRSHD